MDNGQGGVSQPYIDHHELSQSSPFSGYEPGSLKEDKTRQTHYFFPLHLYFFTSQSLWLDLSLIPNLVVLLLLLPPFCSNGSYGSFLILV